MFLVLVLLQSGSPPADFEFRATVTARSLTMEKHGDAELIVTGNGRNVVDIQAPKANGRKTIRNPQIKVNVEARIADPQAAEAAAPQ